MRNVPAPEVSRWLVSFFLLPAVLLGVTPGKALAQCAAPPDPSGDESWFWFNDFGYFRNPQADLRPASIYAQLMPRTDTVPSSGTSSDPFPFEGQEGRTQVEASFGGEVPIVSNIRGGGNCAQGWDAYLFSSVHTLLRWSGRDIVNSDFAFGGGLRTRGFWFLSDRFSTRLRFRHESTHLGDEYTFDGVTGGTLDRYNVSAEAFDFYLAIDNVREFEDTGWYGRAYGGVRMLWGKENGGFLAFDKTAEGRGIPEAGSCEPDANPCVPVEIDPLRYRSRWEFHTGGEWWSQEIGNARWFEGRFFVVGELYWRDRLDLLAPERSRSWSGGLGWLFGQDEQSEYELSARFYGGIHPHGQFRALPGFGYWAIRLGFNP